MSLLGRRRKRSESTDEPEHESGSLEVTVVEDRSTSDSFLFKVGRGLLGGVLTFMAIDNLRNLEERTQYADSMGAPMASLSVPVVSSSLFVGSIGLALWRAPVAAATAVAAFFVSTTPVMHDFWTVEDPEQRQQEMFHFLKNAALLGATLAFVGLGRREE